MSAWIDRILKEFTADLARLWIAADPDNVLLDERVLTGLRERGFELLPFEDSVVFRAEYEERYRAAWDAGEVGPAKALILHFRGTEIDDLPWDYVSQARKMSASLESLFPNLNCNVVRQIGPEHYEAVYAAQTQHASQSLGESLTKDFILTHIFRMSPHLITRPEDLWRELLRLHFRDAVLPPVLGEHVAKLLGDSAAFKSLPLRELFCSKATLLRVVQEAWHRYLSDRGVPGTHTGEPPAPDFAGTADVPFEHPDVRASVASMFQDGLLHPLVVKGALPTIPEWARVGIIPDPLALRNLVADSIKGLQETLPSADSSYRDWISAARKLGEVLARFHSLDSTQAEGLRVAIFELQTSADERLRPWIAKHYADLPSLPVARGPVMVHHMPRFLSLRRGAGEEKIALLVFDGLAVDQWVQIREALAKRAPRYAFDESACFAWLPTLTSVSRQAIFSGLKPRDFADTIESTAPEQDQWTRFWQDQGLRANEVMYRKGIRRNDQLDDLNVALSAPALKIAGIVVDIVDGIVHGAVLGKRGIAAQIQSWCETGFVERLLDQLTSKDFHVYLTADHGNVEAVGRGRSKQGVAAESYGERVRTYRSETLAAESAASNPFSYRLDIAGLPSNYLTVFAEERTAYMPQGEQAVVHGGISIEELIVPFVKVSNAS